MRVQQNHGKSMIDIHQNLGFEQEKKIIHRHVLVVTGCKRKRQLGHLQHDPLYGSHRIFPGRSAKFKGTFFSARDRRAIG